MPLACNSYPCTLNYWSRIIEGNSRARPRQRKKALNICRESSPHLLLSFSPFLLLSVLLPPFTAVSAARWQQQEKEKDKERREGKERRGGQRKKRKREKGGENDNVTLSEKSLSSSQRCHTNIFTHPHRQHQHYDHGCAKWDVDPYRLMLPVGGNRGNLL